MNRAVQEAVQDRDAAGQPENLAIHASNNDPIVAIPTKARPDDGKRALLVNERSTVFDRPAAELLPPDPIDQLRDPIWRTADAQGRELWTPDRVHARLLLTGEVVRRMPSPLRRGYVGVLGQIALTEIASTRRIPPTPEEISLADWTLIEIMQRAHRQVLLASAFGFSGDKIAEIMQARGKRISGSTVQGYYLAERRVLAGQWQARRVPVDSPTLERWAATFCKARN